MFGATLWHASSAWYFVVGALALWFADRCARALRRTQRWELVSLDALGDVTTRLVLRPVEGALGRPLVFEFQCGQCE